MKYPVAYAIVLPACLIAAAVPAAAQTVYTDRAAFDAATTDRAVSDFSNLGSGTGYGQSYSGTDFTLTTGSALLISYDPNSSPDYQFNSGKVLALARFSETAGVITPGAGVTAFGLDFGVLANAANTRVTINGVDYNGIGAPMLSFFGIVSAAGVEPISISFAANRGILDNVTVAVAAPVVTDVPEPAAWGMMLLGFGLVGGGDAPPRSADAARLTGRTPGIRPALAETPDRL